MTSTLQQSASNRLGFSPKKTMMIAQSLYEGVQTNEGFMGAITYMRTDSLNLAKEAVAAAREHILQNYGKEYLGIVRSTFVIGKDGKIVKIYKSVKAKDHAAKVLADLAK